MTKNEKVAKWLGATKTSHINLRGLPIYEFPDSFILVRYSGVGKRMTGYLEFDSDRNWLHEAWVKFRDLKFSDLNQLKEFKLQKDQIAYSIAYWPITEALDELVKGIEWVESLKK